jgi:DNA excision repair protein ERCC-4
MTASRIYIAPTEPAELKRLGVTSTMPERFGCDLLWRARGAWWGVQRKELGDFLASVADGRLGKELGQMADVRASGGTTVLVIEGTPRFTTEGAMIAEYGIGKRFTLASWRKALLSVMETGCGVMPARDTRELADVVKTMHEWSGEAHALAVTRPKAAVPTSSWGEKGNDHWGSWFLQGIPGVGADRADAILKHFGRVPLKLDVTDEELKAVPGLGPKTITAMRKALG